MSLPHRRLLAWSTSLLVSVSLVGCTSAENVPNPATVTAGSDGSTSAPATSAPATSVPATTSPSAVESGSASESASAKASPTLRRPQQDPVAEDVVTDLTTPWAVATLQDGSLLVCERDTSTIKRVVGSKASQVAKISEVVPDGEGGLLGLAISGDERTVFVYYTAAEDNRIVTMSWDGKRLGEPKAILTGIPKGTRHNGGRMVIGPDGHLFVGTGEIGDVSLAQDKKSLAGKILRINQDGTPVKDNPFDNEVYSYGHRNVQGLAFDDDGRLWASEFGDQSWDELNLVRKGSNYGWPEVEGSGQTEGMTNPKVVWPTSEASPSGLAYWRGSLYMAALRGRRLWEIPVDGTDVGKPKAHFVGRYGRLRSVIASEDGDSLLVTTSNTDGRADDKPGDDRILEVTR